MKQKVYSIALRSRNRDFFWNDDNYSFFSFKPKSRRYWIADPFLFDFENKTYMFYEAFDLVKRKGLIGFSIVRDNSVTEPEFVIEEDFHLAFPYVFTVGGDIYLLPDSSSISKIIIYKALSFPYIWQKAELLCDSFSCDTVIVFSDKGMHSLVTSEMFDHPIPNQLTSCYVRNKQYQIEYLSGEFMVDADSAVVVGEGDYGIRNAGACFFEGDLQIRPGQDCRNKMYGCGLVFFRILSVYPYREEIIRTLSKEELNAHLERNFDAPLLGAHTYNISNKYEVVDFSYMDNIPLYISIHRFFFRAIRKTIRIIRRVFK